MAFPPLVQGGQTIASAWGRDVVNALPPIGTIVMWPGDVAPIDWLFCRGQAVNQSTYPGLWNLCKLTVDSGKFNEGLVSTTMFRVPNLKGRYPFGYNEGGGYGAVRVGEVFGAKDATGLPSHTHPGTFDHIHIGGSTTWETGSHFHNTNYGELWQWYGGGEDNVNAFRIGLAGPGDPYSIVIRKIPTDQYPSGPQNAGHYHVLYQTGGPNTANVSVGSAFINTTNANLPPSLSLNFIVRAQ